MNLTWVKDEVTIPTADPRVNTIANGTLRLAHIRQRDAGSYTCTVEADGFLSTNTTRLRVIGEQIPLKSCFNFRDFQSFLIFPIFVPITLFASLSRQGLGTRNEGLWRQKISSPRF